MLCLISEFSDIYCLFEAQVPMCPTCHAGEVCDQQSLSALIFYWKTRGDVIITLFKPDHIKSNGVIFRAEHVVLIKLFRQKMEKQ